MVPLLDARPHCLALFQAGLEALCLLVGLRRAVDQVQQLSAVDPGFDFACADQVLVQGDERRPGREVVGGGHPHPDIGNSFADGHSGLTQGADVPICEKQLVTVGDRVDEPLERLRVLDDMSGQRLGSFLLPSEGVVLQMAGCVLRDIRIQTRHARVQRIELFLQRYDFTLRAGRV